MAQSQESAEERPLEDLRVVDPDVHIIAQDPKVAGMIADRVEGPYREWTDPADGGPFPFPGTAGTGARIPGKISVFGEHTLTDPEEHIEGQLVGEMGVDHPILNITPLWDQYPDTEFAKAEVPATNDTIVEEFLDYSDDYYGMISVPMREPEIAVAEIDRLADESQMVGVMVHPGGQERGLGDPRYDPVWEACDDHGLTVAFHTTATGFMWQMPGLFGEMATMVESHALSHPWTMMWAVTSLIINGAPEKFPDLDWVCLEAGIAWLPYLMARLNRQYEKYPDDMPLLKKSPEEYIRERFHLSTQPLGEFMKVARMRKVIDVLGPEMIMFSSDHPHFDFDNPDSIRAYFDHFDHEDQQAVFGDNAIEAYDLPL